MNTAEELPKIEGYEYTGEFRKPKYGEIVAMGRFVFKNCGDITKEHHIVVRSK